MCNPPPVQQPHPPVWFGGVDPAMLRACARHGQGWNTTPATVAQVREHIRALAAACAEAGRDPATIEKTMELQLLVAPDLDAVRERLRRIVALDPSGQPPDAALRAFLDGETDAVPELRRDAIKRDTERDARARTQAAGERHAHTRGRFAVASRRPRVLLVFNRQVYDDYFRPADRERLGGFAEWEWLPVDGGVRFGPNPDPAARAALLARVGDADGIVVCHGAPLVDAGVPDRAPHLRTIGELEGDRFAQRIDLDAAWERGIRTVDTTHGSSYPVSERTLALIPIALRNAGEHFRKIVVSGGFRGWLRRRHPPAFGGEYAVTMQLSNRRPYLAPMLRPAGCGQASGQE